MGIARTEFDPNAVLDIVAEAMKKQQDMAQKLARMSLELQMKDEKMRIATEALLDIYG